MILCSSGVLFRPEVFDAESILTYGPRLPVDGLEVLVTRRMVGRLSDVADELKSADLPFPVVHAPKRVGAALPAPGAIDQLEETASFATAIGARLIVLHLWDLPDSDRNFTGRLEAAVVAADIAEASHVDLAVETIPCDQGTPLGNVRRVIEHEARIGIALDTEFLAFHNELDAALSEQWLWTDERVRHIHLKDYAGTLFDADGTRRYVLPGEGSIDFRSFFAGLERYNFTGSVSLEAPALLPSGEPDLDALMRTLARISQSPWSFA